MGNSIKDLSESELVEELAFSMLKPFYEDSLVGETEQTVTRYSLTFDWQGIGFVVEWMEKLGYTFLFRKTGNSYSSSFGPTHSFSSSLPRAVFESALKQLRVDLKNGKIQNGVVDKNYNRL